MDRIVPSKLFDFLCEVCTPAFPTAFHIQPKVVEIPELLPSLLHRRNNSDATTFGQHERSPTRRKARSPLPDPNHEYAPAPAPVASAANNCDSRFRPGSIVVYYMRTYTAFLPTDILPRHQFEKCWTAQHLSFSSFLEITQQGLGVTFTNDRLMADVGQPAMMHIKNGKDWRLAMQMCHDHGLAQCKFEVLSEDVVVESVADKATAVQEAPKREQGSRLAAIGAVGVVAAAGFAAVQMGILPSLLPF
ncbi:hypothetical protein EJ07DRAFT_156572 [Lizonia empirigonia]|nr:hypothetical protein EJ07DRAFT_156572 [Lizonia empirigonia]